MSISGNLEDVSVAEVMQFIHLGGKTGTLEIESGDRSAEVGFHRGKIINAGTPGSRRLGAVLLENGLIDQATLEDALRRQTETRPRVSLGKLLLHEGAIDADDLRTAMAEEIERTIYELVTWNQGEFRFALDELRPLDDIAVYPGDILPDINLNTQMVVLDALRIFDERNRERLALKGQAGEAESDSEPLAAGAAATGTETRQRQGSLVKLFGAEATGNARTGGALKLDPEAAVMLPPEARLQVVSKQAALIADLGLAIPKDLTEIAHVEMRDAGLTLPGESPPVVLIDLRGGKISVEELANMRRARPRATLIALTDQETPAAAAYEAGALAVLPDGTAAITACLDNVFRNRQMLAEVPPPGPPASSGFAKLRRVVADLRSGLLSATVALNLMKVISESVERAIMFLVRDRRLVALGAFGFSADDKPLAGVTRGLEVDLDSDSVLAAAVDDGQARSLMFEESLLPEPLASILGRPRTGQAVIFPVLGSERVISVVYTDNGQSSREIEEIEILELAAAQVGVAFENEMLRRKMARQAPKTG